MAQILALVSDERAYLVIVQDALLTIAFQISVPKKFFEQNCWHKSLLSGVGLTLGFKTAQIAIVATNIKVSGFKGVSIEPVDLSTLKSIML